MGEGGTNLSNFLGRGGGKRGEEKKFTVIYGATNLRNVTKGGGEKSIKLSPYLSPYALNLGVA